MRRLLLLLGAGSAALHCGGFRAVGPSSTRLRTLLPPVPATTAARRASPIASDELVRGIGAGRELPSPSGLNTLTKPLQAGVVLGISVAIAALALAIAGPGFAAVRGSDLWNLSRPTWPALGLIYLAAGVAHFTEAEGFENITPPNGTWGLWWTPFSPRVNVYWTGVVEIFGGEGTPLRIPAGRAQLTHPVQAGGCYSGRSRPCSALRSRLRSARLSPTARSHYSSSQSSSPRPTSTRSRTAPTSRSMCAFVPP